MNLNNVFAASSARTVSGNSGAVEGFEVASRLRAQLEVTATSGTSPTLDVVLEDTVDQGATLNAIGTFTQKVGPGREVINVTNLFTDRLRARWTVAGTTPSFTFSVRVYSE